MLSYHEIINHHKKLVSQIADLSDDEIVNKFGIGRADVINSVDVWKDERLEIYGLVMNRIRGKLFYATRTDSRTKFKACQPTISEESAFKLLKASKGKCCICGCKLELHNWQPSDLQQFSFDRLNDNDTHHEGNLQVTCLGCNLGKARQQYGERNEEFFPEYSQKIKEFFIAKDDKIRDELAELHDKVYGDKKPNNWRRRVVVK